MSKRVSSLKITETRPPLISGAIVTLKTVLSYPSPNFLVPPSIKPSYLMFFSLMPPPTLEIKLLLLSLPINLSPPSLPDPALALSPRPSPPAPPPSLPHFLFHHFSLLNNAIATSRRMRHQNHMPKSLVPICFFCASSQDSLLHIYTSCSVILAARSSFFASIGLLPSFRVLFPSYASLSFSLPLTFSFLVSTPHSFVIPVIVFNFAVWKYRRPALGSLFEQDKHWRASRIAELASTLLPRPKPASKRKTKSKRPTPTSNSSTNCLPGAPSTPPFIAEAGDDSDGMDHKHTED